MLGVFSFSMASAWCKAKASLAAEKGKGGLAGMHSTRMRVHYPKKVFLGIFVDIFRKINMYTSVDPR